MCVIVRRVTHAGNQAFPLLGKVVNRMYLQMLKSAPFIWEYLYDNPNV